MKHHAPASHRQGRRAERFAALALRSKGLQPLDANYRCRWGEVDLVMKDADTIVFVEVRYRRRSGFGDGADSVDRRKRAKLVRAAQHFLQHHPDFAKWPCRFDVVAVTEEPDSTRRVDWIRDAFEA
jgi:putative endonuclease